MPDRLRSAAAALALGAALLLVPGLAGAQKPLPTGPGAPASTALPPGHPAVGQAMPAGHPPTAQGLPAGHPPTDQALPAGHPPTDQALPAGHPPADQALPPGHPPTAQGLPAGHPSLADEEDDDGGPAQGARANGFFQPPEDTADDDATLPPGTIVVRIADAQGRPMPRAPVSLGILKNSVAKGESTSRLERQTDETGSVRFDGLETGSGVSYRVTTSRGPATYGVPPFALSAGAGTLAVLHSYDVTSDLDEALVGIQALVYVSLKEDAMSIEQLYNIINVGPVTWVPDGVTVTLPAGYKAYTKPDSMDDTRFDEVEGKGAALRGTFKPGQSSLTYRYQVPLTGDEHQTLRIELPPHVAQARVMLEASKSMSLSVTNFPGAQKTQNRDGKRILLTERAVSRAEGAMKVIEISVTGLPTEGPGRWIAVGLGVASILAGALYVMRRREGGPLPDDTRRDLVDAKNALLDEIVALERAHKRGEIGPKAYGRIRVALVDALARIVRRLEDGGAHRRKPLKDRPRPSEQPS